MLGSLLYFSTPAFAADCNYLGNNGGGCPTVHTVKSSGGTASVSWTNDGNALTFASLSSVNTGDQVWGLYMLYDWTLGNGHWFSGGTMQPIMTVNRDDPPLMSDGKPGLDFCSTRTYPCTHDQMAARFLQKYGYAGTVSVALPPSAKKICMVFGGINSYAGEFNTVFKGSQAVNCDPGSPGAVEPDPEWCGMNTSALTFDFGDMAPAAVAGSTLTKTAVMDCSKAGVTYNLYLSNVSTSGRNTINLGRGVSAIVSANNQTLQTNRTSTGTTNSLNVTVTLNGTPTSTGAISGLGILAVNYL